MRIFTSTLMSLFVAGSAMAQTNLLTNASFEEWNGNVPTDWVSTTTASSATIEKSTDARTGSASILAMGNSSSNKRIAYKELILKAGSYEFTIYAKSATAELGSARPGYAPINEDGSMGTYVYGEYANDLSNTEWTLVSYSFDLAEETKLNLVVMNSKNPGKDLLFDDASLTTTDGGIVEGGTDPDPDPTENIIFETSFNNGDAAGFEFKDVNTGGLDYVWKADSYGYLKASAYANSTNHETESWAVSPVMNLTQVDEAKMTFRHAMNFVKAGEPQDYARVYVSENYSGDVQTATWNELTVATYPDGQSWTFVDSGEFDLTSYCGKNVVIAFKYTSTSEAAPTWEVDNLKIFAPLGSSIDNVSVDMNAPVEIYNINGVMVGNSLDELSNGIYLVRQGTKVNKVIKR